MRHDLLAVEARLRVSHEDLTNEVFGFRRDRSPGRRVEVILAALNLLEEREVIFVVEGG